MNRDLHTAVASMFAPTSAPARRQIGVEIELIPSVQVALAEFEAVLTPGVRASLEPGGQLELSLPPSTSVRRLVHDAAGLVSRARAVAAARGATLDLVGVDPRHEWDELPLRTVSPRYLAMQQFFDGVGQDGRRMMRLTAALQVCVDLLPGRAGVEQWLVANLAGPALVAEFANCPHVPRSRTAIWRGVDMHRTGYDGRHIDASDPVGAYASFAAAAERFPIPEARDATYHLTTLFPPVRPRGGYLELRYLDAQPVARVGAAVNVLAGLLFEPQTRREALGLLLPRLGSLDASWRAAASGRCAESSDLLALARTGMARLPACYLHETSAA